MVWLAVAAVIVAVGAGGGVVWSCRRRSTPTTEPQTRPAPTPGPDQQRPLDLAGSPFAAVPTADELRERARRALIDHHPDRTTDTAERQVLTEYCAAISAAQRDSDWARLVQLLDRGAQ